MDDSQKIKGVGILKMSNEDFTKANTKPPAFLTVGTFNNVPAAQRKTVGGKKYVVLNGEWRLAELMQKIPSGETCLSIPSKK